MKLAGLLVVLTVSLSAWAQDDNISAIADEIVVTTHTIAIDGEPLHYNAHTGTIVMKEEDGTPKATVFFIAYTKRDVSDVSERPLTFSFNGGPGSSSVWLHLGTFGPRRVKMDPDGMPLPPPYELLPNEYSILDLTDLVFIDPVSTGYSRAVEGESPSQFHGVNEDIRSVGDFIRLYMTRYNRWSSPVFLAGESYGTTRAAGLSGYLQDRHGLYLNGLILVSSILNFQTARFDVGNDLPYLLFLPTYTATAWYHNQLEDDLQNRSLDSVLVECEEFVMNELVVALMKGDALPNGEQQEIAEHLARFTGLDESFILGANLRVPIFAFTKELMRDERRTVGRLDSRFIGIDRTAIDDSYEYDPSLTAISGPYTATLNDYVRRELGFESDLPYEILTGRVHPWNYGDYQNRYLNVAETLRSAMTRNQDLHVLVASGYYDLATPYFATEYTFDHLQLDPVLQDNISMTYYESGHMMYIHYPSLIQLKVDIAEWMDAVLE